jgi:G3E family GTPase
VGHRAGRPGIRGRALNNQQPLPITIIAGYLGAGKTTLINACLRTRGERRIAVLVNDFGEVNVDAALIKGQSDTLLELAGGCVCCSIGSDLMQALSNLAALHTERHFDHVLLETSGVALPLPISQSIRLLPQYRVANIIALADVGAIEGQLNDRYVADTVQRQLQQAHMIILSKGDATSVPKQHVLDQLRSFQKPLLWLSQDQCHCDGLLGHADFLAAHWKSVNSYSEDLSASEESLLSKPSTLNQPMRMYASAFEQLSLSIPEPLTRPQLTEVLQALINLARSDPPLLRAKGFFCVQGADPEWRLIQQVGVEQEVTALESDPPSAATIVLIALRPALSANPPALQALKFLLGAKPLSKNALDG